MSADSVQSEPAPFPPFTSLADYPLHGWDYGSSYACQGGAYVYDWRCWACVDLAQTEVVEGRDRPSWWRQSAEHEERRVNLSWLVARSRFFGVKAPA